jgi:hypothetical protein
MYLNCSTMSNYSKQHPSFLCYDNGTGNSILGFCVLQTKSTTLDTPEKAASWFRNLFRTSGCVKGLLVPENPGVYVWNFYVNPCFKSQLSPSLWTALYNFERDWPSQSLVYYYTKKEGNHSIVRSDHPRHRKVTEPVDMDVYDQWDKKCSFHEFCMMLDPSLKDEKAQYLPFGPEHKP